MMNGQMKNESLMSLKLPDTLVQSRSSIRSSARNNVIKTERFQLTDQEYAYNLFINKLRRIIYTKMRAYFSHIKITKNTRILVKLLQGKTKRNLRQVFTLLISKGFEYQESQISTQIQIKRNAKLLCLMIEKTVLRFQRMYFSSLKNKAIHQKKIELFSQKLCQTMKALDRQIYQDFLEKVIHVSVSNKQKEEGCQQIVRIIPKFILCYQRSCFQAIIRFIQSQQINSTKQSKISAKEKVNEFYCDRNAMASSMKEELKFLKNTIDYQSSERHKTKMQYIRTSNTKKQELKEMNKKSVRVISQLQKVNHNLDIDYNKLSKHYQKRKDCIEKANNSENKIITLYKRIIQGSASEIKEEISNYPKQELYELDNYHFIMNQKSHHLINLYETNKVLCTKKWKQQEEASNENTKLRGLLKTMVEHRLDNIFHLKWKQY